MKALETKRFALDKTRNPLFLWVLGCIALCISLSACGGGGPTGEINIPVPSPRDTTPPAAPTGLSAEAFDAAVTLTWQPNTDQDLAGYIIYSSTAFQEPEKMTRRNNDPVTAVTYHLTELTNDTTYYFAIRAVDTNDNMSFFSSTASATPESEPVVPPPVEPPGPPANLTVQPGAATLTLSWIPSPSAGVTEYYVYRAVAAPGPFALITTVSQGPYTDAQLNEDATYYYYVKAYSSNGLFSEASSTASGSPIIGDTTPPLKPTGLGALAGNGSVALTWNPNSEPDLAGYKVYMGTNPGALSLATPGAISQTGYTAAPLTNGTTYYFAISAVDASNNESQKTATVSATPATVEPPVVQPPNPPANLTVITGYASLTLSWIPSLSPGVADYYVYRAFTASGPFAIITTVAQSPYINTQLNEDVIYYYYVKAHTSDGLFSEASNTANGRPILGDTTPPSMPTGLGAQAGSESAALTWNPNSEPDLAGYRVYMGISPGALSLAAPSTISQTSYTATSLTNGTTYYFAISAVDTSNNESQKTQAVSATPMAVEPPPPQPPAAPTGLEAQAGDTFVELDWHPNAEPNLLGYNVYRLLQPGQFQRINTSLAASESYTASSLQNDTEYTFAVTAVIEGGLESDYSATASATPFHVDVEPPSPPAGLQATPMDGQASLSWVPNDEPDLAGYTLWFGTGPETADMTLEADLGPTVHEYNFTDLINGTTYYFALRACDGNQNISGFSSVVSATPMAVDLTPPPVPNGLTAQVENDAVSLAWNPVAAPDLAGYRVYRTTITPLNPVNLEQISPGIITVNSFTDNTAANETLYYYVVTSEDTNGNESALSDEASAMLTGHYDWPMFKGGPAHDGIALSPLNTPLPAQPSWTFSSGGEITANPAVYNGIVYFGNTLGYFYSVNASSGALIWSRLLTQSWVVASPAVAGDGVYIGTYNGIFFKLDRGTGDMIWNYVTPGEQGVQFISSPVLSSDKVFFGGSDGNLYALNRQTGELEWKFTAGNQIWSSPALVDGIVYFGSANTRIYAVNAETGAQVWSFATGGKIFSSPLIANGYLYIGSTDYKLYKLNAADGALVWSFTADTGIDSTPTLYNGKVYFGTGSYYLGGSNASVYAVNDATGLRVERRTGSAFFEASPVVAGGMLWIGCWNKILYGFNPDSIRTAPLWTFTTGGEIHAPVTVADNMLFLASRDGTIYAFGP